jgi:hypothetical protein
MLPLLTHCRDPPPKLFVDIHLPPTNEWVGHYPLRGSVTHLPTNYAV